jgi:probable HAF family extracellular repeat protein
MRKSLLPAIVVALVATAMVSVTAPTRAATAPRYTVQDLGTLPGDYSSTAMGINAFGDVVGWSAGPNGTRAFLYTNATGMAALAGPSGRPVTTARAVNANGTVVGNASTGGTDIGHAVRWQSGVPRDLGTLGTGTFSDARGVNSAGVTVGSSYTNGGGLLGIHAFRFADASGMVDLTPASDSAHAEAINDAGQVAGWRDGRAFRLTGTTFTDLGVPTGFAQSFGSAINSSGQVAGHVISGTGNSEKIFRYTNGAMVVLGGLGEFNRALGINTAGDVVGYGLPVLGLRQGFVYTDANGMQGLNQLIDSTSGWYILGAGGINDAGQIAGWASGPTGQRAVRLTPGAITPPPPPAPPNAPSALTGSVLSSGAVRLTWTDNSGNELTFRIQRATGTQGTFAFLSQVGANVTTFTDTTATAGKAYRYRVRAVNAAGVSAWSNTISVRVRR